MIIKNRQRKNNNSKMGLKIKVMENKKIISLIIKIM